MKVAVLFHRLGPYHHARLRALAQRCDVAAIELSAVDNTYAWDAVASQGGYSVHTLFADADADAKPARAVFQKTRSALEVAAPDVVAIPGWESRASMAALGWCRKAKIPAVLMSESTELDEPRTRLKEWIKSRVVQSFAAALVGGTRHVDYVVKLGLARRRVFTGYDAVDNGYFAASSDDVRANPEALKARLGLAPRYFLASSRFVEKKNLPRVLEAYSAYVQSRGGESWDLVILGDGPLRAALERQILSLGLDERVRLPGFKQYGELPAYYGLASAFIHASTTEQWGLVVNEAMASALPVLVSDRCGCAPDLVVEGMNGFTFDPYDVEDLSARMAEMSSGAHDVRAMGLASRTLIEHWGSDAFADNLVRAAHVALSSSMPNIGAFDRALIGAIARR